MADGADDGVPEDAAGDTDNEQRTAAGSADAPSRPLPHPHARRWLTGTHASSAVIGVLTLLLGFGIAVQVHANSGDDGLSSLREDDLIGILDNQDARAERLRQQIAEQQSDLAQLQSSGDRSAAARKQAAEQRTALGILLGTIPAKGPGITVRITDPASALSGEDLLDVVEELRGAGAEAIQFGPVRMSTDSSFQGDGGSVSVDGTALRAPYEVVAIGDPKTLDTALNIPGGVAATVRTAGGVLAVGEHPSVTISVVRGVSQPKYAKPSH